MREWILAFKYARRELRAGLKGFYVFLACLAMGVAAIAGVQSLSAGMFDSLRYNGRLILGGDIALRTIYQPATVEQKNFLMKRGILTVVMESRAMVQTKKNQKTSLVEVKAVDPFYPLYGMLDFVIEDETGKKLDGVIQEFVLAPKDGPGGKETDLPGALVEKELLTRLGVSIGDVIVLGGADFRLRGIIAHEPDRISARHFILAPRVMISSFIMNQRTNLVAHGNQVYYDHRIRAPQARLPEDFERIQNQIIDAFPEAKWKGRNLFNAAPRMRRMIDKLTQFLTLTGLAALLIGGVGISNAVRSFLDGKRAHIATLKCLGASGKFIIRVYMSMIMLLTALGVFAGLVLGGLGGHFAGGIIAERLNMVHFAGFYPGALLLSAAFGFAASLCFSIWPVARGAAVPPNDLFRDMLVHARWRPGIKVLLWIMIAVQILVLLVFAVSTDQGIALWFVVAAVLSFGVFALYAGSIKFLLSRFHLKKFPELRMAVANIYRPGNITTGVILSLGLGLAVLVTVTLVQDRMIQMLTRDLAEDTPSFFFLDVKPDQKEDFRQIVSRYTAPEKLVMTASFRGRITRVNDIPAVDALVDPGESWVISSDRGFTWARAQPAHSDITEGAWWPEDYQGPPQVSIATNVARAFDIGVGDTLTVNIYGVPLTATVANVRDIDWSSFTMNFAVTFAPGSLLEKAPANLLATAVVLPKDEENLQNDIVQAMPNVTVVKVRDALEAAQKILRGVAAAIKASAGAVLVMGILVLSGGIAAARRRHIYDAVVLNVLGAGQRRILKIFLYEYGLLGVLTAVIAGVLGVTGARSLIVHLMGYDWDFRWLVLLGILSLALIVTVTIGFIGTWRALLQKPAPYLRNK